MKTLSQLSRFWTGFERPLRDQPLDVIQLENGKYPQAATCFLQLQLPKPASQEDFDTLLMEAIQYSDHFGRM